MLCQSQEQELGSDVLSRPLYLLAKPPPVVRDLIWALPQTDKLRPAHLLHITLLRFVDLADAPSGFVSALTALLDGFTAVAFHVVFDQIIVNQSTFLKGSEPMAGVRRLQAELTHYLRQQHFPFSGRPPEPHITINYGGGSPGSQVIDPISWTVDEILLIESVVGHKRHEPHGRWSLRSKVT